LLGLFRAGLGVILVKCEEKSVRSMGTKISSPLHSDNAIVTYCVAEAQNTLLAAIYASYTPSTIFLKVYFLVWLA
jgi:hypothetical protein